MDDAILLPKKNVYSDPTFGQRIVGVVAGLVKVANGQTDRLARILWLRGH